MRYLRDVPVLLYIVYKFPPQSPRRRKRVARGGQNGARIEQAAVAFLTPICMKFGKGRILLLFLTIGDGFFVRKLT